MSPWPVWLVMRALKYSLQEARTERWALKLRFSTTTVTSHRMSFCLCSSRQRSTCVLCTDDWNVNSEVLQPDIVMLNYIYIIVKKEMLYMKENNLLNMTLSHNYAQEKFMAVYYLTDRIYNRWTLAHTRSWQIDCSHRTKIWAEAEIQSFTAQNQFHRQTLWSHL